MTEQVGIQVKARMENGDVTGIEVADKIVGVGTIYEHVYDTPVKQAVRKALMIVVELLVSQDDIMDDSFVLRFETHGNQVQALLEKQDEITRR